MSLIDLQALKFRVKKRIYFTTNPITTFNPLNYFLHIFKIKIQKNCSPFGLQFLEYKRKYKINVLSIVGDDVLCVNPLFYVQRGEHRELRSLLHVMLDVMTHHIPLTHV